MDKYTGKRLDKRYEIHELIGVGGMAVVYRAYDIVEEKIVAIKILKDEYLQNKEFIRRFKNESKAIAVLSDPNIVKVFDVSFGTKIQYIVMEYIDGITLKEYIAQRQTINFEDAVHFTCQILKALDHAHSKGVVHRDIKPQNIMLLKDGTIKVTDFGIARVARNDTQTMTDRAIGSVHYIAPEQAKGGVTDEKVDIYSVGVILYELITGKLPFEADNAVSVAIMQMQSKPVPPSEINKDIPKSLEEITLHAMQKNALCRYASAYDMMADIEKFKANPSAHFDYKNFSQDTPTRYVDSISDPKNNGLHNDFKDAKMGKEKSKTALIVSTVAIVVFLFAAVCIFIFSFNSCKNGAYKDVDVPNLIGQQFSDIEKNPDLKFNWKVEPVHDANQPEGVIIDQDPKPYSKKIKEGQTITLQVNSSGILVTVPAVAGLSEEMAKNKLINAGLKFEVLMVSDEEVPNGIVKLIDPQDGTKVTVETTVKLFVSRGPEEKKVNMPDVIGKPLSTAKAEITSKGLKVADQIIYEDSDKLKDVVITSDPLPGVSVNAESSVKLTVSSGVKREKSITINVDLPKEITYEIPIKSYLDGKLYDSASIIPSEVKNGIYTLEVKGKTGKKTMVVSLSGKQYRIYEIDFDASANNLHKTAEFPYEPITAINSDST